MKPELLTTMTFLLLSFGPVHTAPASEEAAKPASYSDYLFPGSGRVSATASTGLPFAALGEISVGIGDRVAAGAFVAGGPFVGGMAVGLYPRVDALHVGPMRLGR